MSNDYFLGIDVGTGSVRAGLISTYGKVVRSFVKNIKTWNVKPDYYEQSSDDIWAACVQCIKEVTKSVQPENIKGIGFDATCSLVCIGTEGKPVSVSPTGANEQNIILWMDHRASKEAEKINYLNHPILKYVGGKISLEMQTPKLMWLKENLFEECWKKADLFFDLPDFLTWRATGCETRSLCSLVCKWNYEAVSNTCQQWNSRFFEELGLEDLQADEWRKIGSTAQNPGSPVGTGLSEYAASELGLLVGTPVGTSMIDAHAGGLGLIGCCVENLDQKFSTRLCLICGTSTCHMIVSERDILCPGIWGPYFGAMVPGMWLNEGGQSATGKLIDHIIDTHPATPTIIKNIGNRHIQEYLSEVLQNMAKEKDLTSPTFLTKELHVWPDFHGNRSPIADPSMKGSICGLTLDDSENTLALLYLATIQALSYGTRHIIESLKKSGHSNLESILICGGLSKNPLFIQTQADVANLPVVCPDEPESVLLGSSILGASAAGYFGDMNAATQKLGGQGKVIYPQKDVQDFHDRKYKVFLMMFENQINYRKIMNS